MTVIALTQEMGSLAKDVAEQVARDLGLEVMRHEVVDHVASRMHVAKSLIHRLREGKAGAIERSCHCPVEGARAAAMVVVVERALHGQCDVVVGRQVGEDAGDLERVGNAEAHTPVRRQVGDVFAVESDRA